jgi:uncharacterized Fe-S cluster protein YjdI
VNKSLPTRVYVNGPLIVEWRPELCIHCGSCTSGLPSVFNLDKRPWVNIHGASEQEIRDQVSKCPSQALSIGDLVVTGE